MILSDILFCEEDLTWHIARQCGVENAVVRLPEKDFDPTDRSHFKTIEKRFSDFGFKMRVLEPMPNFLHDHIKAGDEKRDESIEKVIKMLPLIAECGIDTICFNFMAHVGWTRTSERIEERGGALVSGFDIKDYLPTGKAITKKELWENYEYFISATLLEAEKYGIKLALHPDDPPIEKLGEVERILTSVENIKKAVNIVKSDFLGVTFCQANFKLMEQELEKTVREFRDKIFFLHFRNVVGEKTSFRETFHDNGSIKMAEIMKLYKRFGISVPVRVDHVPLMLENDNSQVGYSAIGRLYAIGYLRGIVESVYENV